MTRQFKRKERVKKAQGKREAAIARLELMYPTSERVSATGPTSMAVKAEDPELRRLIDEALAKRNPRN